MKKVCLFNLEQVGVIYCLESGISFFNQVGTPLTGDTRENEVLSQEGVFAPLSNDAPDGFPSLLKLFDELKEGVATVAAFNEVLGQLSSSDLISVDASRFAESRWGWLYLSIVPQGDFSQFDGFEEGKAVMTWPVSTPY